MEIIQQFGIEPVLLVAQIINFLVLFFLLKKFAYRPILKMLQDRKKIIEESVRQSEKAKEALDSALAEEKNILKKAQTNAAKILLDAKSQADELMVEAREQAGLQVKDMMREAKHEMDQKRVEMEKSLAKHTAILAVDLVKQAVKNVFSENDQKTLIAKMTGNLKKVN